jgi:hypothetical protein
MHKVAKMAPKVRPVEDRFWEKVDKSGDCWLWTACLNNLGYGTFMYNTTPIGSHRMAWLLTYGMITDGMFLLHSCDNPKCVNPSHLREGTHAENMNDMKQRKRVRNGSSRLTDEQVEAIRSSADDDVSLATRYRCSRSHIKNIKAGRRRANQT